MTKSNCIRVIMADDHQLLIDSVKQILQDTKDIKLMGAANHGQSLLKLLESQPVDVVLLDMQMPVMDGKLAATKIKKKYPHIKLLVLSMFENQRHVEQMLKLGASGYLLKNTGKSQLIKSIRAVHQGEIVVDPKIAERYYQRLSQPEKVSFLPELTRREKQILQLISQEKTTAEIAQSLFVSLNTVEYHRKNLLVKFGAKNSVGLIKEALQKGILER